jgi:hypothetical protein
MHIVQGKFNDIASVKAHPPYGWCPPAAVVPQLQGYDGLVYAAATDSYYYESESPASAAIAATAATGSATGVQRLAG